MGFEAVSVNMHMKKYLKLFSPLFNTSLQKLFPSFAKIIGELERDTYYLDYCTECRPSASAGGFHTQLVFCTACVSECEWNMVLLILSWDQMLFKVLISLMLLRGQMACLQPRQSFQKANFMLEADLTFFLFKKGDCPYQEDTFYYKT